MDTTKSIDGEAVDSLPEGSAGGKGALGIRPMRVTFLSTGSGETKKYGESFTSCIEADLDWIQYDLPTVTDAGLYAAVKEAKPDLIVYIGSRWGSQPSTASLARLNAKIAPMVHLCSDAADLPWHDLLREYHDAGAFAVQVAIDGNDNWPGAAQNLTLLTPVAASHFPAVSKSHAERQVICGYAGNPGAMNSNRRLVLNELMLYNMLVVRMRTEAPNSYAGMCAFLAETRMSLNIPYSGTEAAFQVKGRVVETGVAGGCLLEVAGAPTNRWFRPGLDYLEFDSMPACREMVERLTLAPEETQAIGESLRTRVQEEHSPAVFWSKVLEKIGLGTKAVKYGT